MAIRIASFLSAFFIGVLVVTTGALAATLDVQISTEPGNLDPQMQSGDWSDWIVGDLFEGLVSEDAAGNPVAGQAESWSVSSDGLTYSFKLRGGLKWSDGEPLTSVDFMLAFHRLLAPKNQAEFAFIQFPIKNAEAFNTGKISDAAEIGVAAPDARTLVLKLEKPMPYFLQALVQPSAFPSPKHLIDKVGAAWAKPENIVSNGAFKLADWQPGSELKAIPNGNYRAAGDVKLDEVIYHFADDEAGTLASYLAGDVDIATQFPAAKAAELGVTRPGEARIVPTLGVWYYVLNLKTPPFNDPMVRRALSMAIDRERIGTGLLDTGQPAAYGMVPLGVPGFDSDLYMPDWIVKSREQRVAEATALMQSAGYGPDKPINSSCAAQTCRPR